MGITDPARLAELAPSGHHQTKPHSESGLKRCKSHEGVHHSPWAAGSGHLADVPEPVAESGQARVQVLAVGVDGTDRELLDGKYGEAPSKRRRAPFAQASWSSQMCHRNSSAVASQTQV